MPLTIIEYGALASSEVMNDNFSYLDNRVTTVANNLTSTSSAVYSNIASMNSTFSEQIDDIESDIDDLETDLETLRDDFDSYNFAPDYSYAVAITLSNGDAVDFDGWLAIRFRASGGNDVVISINSVPIVSGLAGGNDVCGGTSTVPVSAGDIITWSGPIINIYLYKIPFLGGE